MFTECIGTHNSEAPLNGLIGTEGVLLNSIDTLFDSIRNYHDLHKGLEKKEKKLGNV